jgi:cytochrome c oxidase assembly factor CtaG
MSKLKTFACASSFVLGLIVLGVWAVGSHGHIMFRPHMAEDWILASLLIIFFGIPLYLFLLNTFGPVDKI